MLRHVSIKRIMAIFGLSLFLPAIASAACYVDGASGRLANYCAVNKIKGARVDIRAVQLIDYKLKLEGSTRGLDLPTRVKPHSTSRAGHPILFYSDNINGGNSPEPLVLGNLTLEGDEKLYRKKGVVAGFGAGFSGRYIHEEGKYITYGANGSYAQSSQYGLGIATTSANFSSINHIKNWWFLDAHINTSRVRKDITDQTSNNISLVSSKVYSNAENTFSEASVGVNRYFAESYNQNQLFLGYKNIHASGLYSALKLTVGENIKTQLSTKLALDGQLTKHLASKPLKLSASYSHADGGALFGVARDEATITLSASYPVSKSLTASVGYKNTDSSIDYFDVSAPTFGLQLKSLSF